MSREFVLKDCLGKVKQNYDFVLIDCMPSLGILTVNALTAANSVIIPTQPSYLSTKGLSLLLRSIFKVKRQINPNLRIDGILMTMVDNRTNDARTIIASLREQVSENLRMAIFLFLGFGSVMKQSADDASEKRKKQKSFKQQSKVSKSLEALQHRQRMVIEQSPLPNSLYFVLTVACAFGGFFAGRVVFSSLFLSIIVGVLALLTPMIVISFRQSKSKSKRLNRLASSMGQQIADGSHRKGRHPH